MPEIPTNKIGAVRVSKTSFRSWTLYGAVDQALKTSCQADAVKAIPIHVSVHGEDVEVELWINATPASPLGGDEFNPPAQVILEQAEMAKRGLNRTVELMTGGYERIQPKFPLVKGIAILTGAGCTDFPDGHMECTLAALVGQPEDGDDD